uniref:E3 ubiquitin-protein ligase n=1 Tax=Syphacia muris TaxID=451379 RepID=A0A158R508_9BILA
MLDQHPNANSNLKWDLLRISVEQGDITKGISDVIIIPCDENLQCNSGVARAVIQAGGALLQDTIAVCALETNGLEHAQPVISPGCFNLDTGHIVLVYSSKTSVDGLTECYKRALEAADDRLDATIVTLAPFGTGGLKARPEDSAAAAFKAIFDCGVVFNKIQLYVLFSVNPNLRYKQASGGRIQRMYEIVEDKEEEDIKKIADKFFKVVPSPEEKMGTLEAEDVCAICYDSLFEPAEKDVVVQLRKCGHIFHRECVKEAFTRVQVRCPMCKRWYSAPKGNQPTGSTMIVTTCEGTVPGFPDAKGYFFIEYSLPGGIQTVCHFRIAKTLLEPSSEEHPRPGLRFSGVRRYAYLPNTIEGEKVLRLFKLAFINRLMFTVGDRETGRRNVVIFNGIETKSTLKGGPKMSGFPDPDYLPRVKVELAAVGITEQLLETLE